MYDFVKQTALAAVCTVTVSAALATHLADRAAKNHVSAVDFARNADFANLRYANLTDIRLADSGDDETSDMSEDTETGEKTAPAETNKLFEQWKARAAARLKAEAEQFQYRENAAAKKFPEEFVVTCEAGCRPGRDVVVSLVSKKHQPLAEAMRLQALMAQPKAAAEVKPNEAKSETSEPAQDIDGAKVAGALHPTTIECIAGCYEGRRSYRANGGRNAANDASKRVQLARAEIARDVPLARSKSTLKRKKRNSYASAKQQRSIKGEMGWRTKVVFADSVKPARSKKSSKARAAASKAKRAKPVGNWVTAVLW
jgi:hypothetical protein